MASIWDSVAWDSGLWDSVSYSTLFDDVIARLEKKSPSGTTTGTQTEVIIDGGFETEDYGGYPWLLNDYASFKNVDPNDPTVFPHSGNLMIYLDFQGAFQHGELRQTVSVLVENMQLLSFWYKASGGVTCNPSLWLEFSDESVPARFHPSTSAAAWTQYNITQATLTIDAHPLSYYAGKTIDTLFFHLYSPYFMVLLDDASLLQASTFQKLNIFDDVIARLEKKNVSYSAWHKRHNAII